MLRFVFVSLVLACGDSSAGGGSAGASSSAASTGSGGASGAAGSSQTGGGGGSSGAGGGGGGMAGGPGIDAGELCPADVPAGGSPCTIDEFHCLYCVGPEGDGGCSFSLDVVCVDGQWRVPR